MTIDELKASESGTVIRPNEEGPLFILAIKLADDSWTVTGVQIIVTIRNLFRIADEWILNHA